MKSVREMEADAARYAAMSPREKAQHDADLRAHLMFLGLDDDPPDVVVSPDGLTFDNLRAANALRLPTFKNARGEPAHSEPDGSDWCLAQWCNAVCGELGELANLIKKVERGDLTLDQARESLGKECADVVTYLDILAQRIGVNLGDVTVAKFNEVSQRVGSPVRLLAVQP